MVMMISNTIIKKTEEKRMVIVINFANNFVHSKHSHITNMNFKLM
jgi:hypothetical protein